MMKIDCHHAMSLELADESSIPILILGVRHRDGPLGARDRHADVHGRHGDARDRRGDGHRVNRHARTWQTFLS